MRKRLTIDEWLRRAKKVHGDRYDYSMVNYVNYITDVKVICKVHGDFNIKTREFFRGAGCNLCVTDKNMMVFSERGRELYGDKYDYSKVMFRTLQDKVTITCESCGDIKQRVWEHLKGFKACKCKITKSRDLSYLNKPTHVYVMTSGNLVKVGLTTNIDFRVETLNKRSPFVVNLFCSWEFPDFLYAFNVEKLSHSYMREFHAGLVGFDGATEWFNTTPAHAAETIKRVMNEMGL